MKSKAREKLTDLVKPINDCATYPAERDTISTALVGVKSNRHLTAYEFTGEQCVDTADASVTPPFIVFRE